MLNNYEGEKSNFTVEKPGRDHLQQFNKLNIHSNETMALKYNRKTADSSIRPSFDSWLCHPGLVI